MHGVTTVMAIAGERASVTAAGEINMIGGDVAFESALRFNRGLLPAVSLTEL
jgi:hypothetical protein